MKALIDPIEKNNIDAKIISIVETQLSGIVTVGEEAQIQDGTMCCSTVDCEYVDRSFYTHRVYVRARCVIGGISFRHRRKVSPVFLPVYI